MSSIDRIRKKVKRLEEERQTGVKTTQVQSSMDNIESLITERKNGGIQYNVTDDIAPLRNAILTNQAKEEEERTWFQKGAFGDDKGNVVTDIIDTILGTGADVGIGVVKGIFNIGEGIGDLITYGEAELFDAFGNEEFADNLRQEAQKSLADEWFNPIEDTLAKSSVIGEKGDSITEGLGFVAGTIATGGLAGSAGKAGGLVTTAKGAQALATGATTGQTFLTSMGSSMGEAYRSGASDKEAWTYGTIGGLAEAGTELLFGGLGKSINAVGLSKGLSSADDQLAKAVGSKFKSTLAKNLAEYGVKAGAEGFEEVASGVIQAMGQKLTYASEEEITQLINDQNLLEQFITGAVVSGITQTPGLVSNTKAGQDFITGNTDIEQKVVDEMIEKRKQELLSTKKEGETLSTKEIGKIEKEVQEDFENGRIDVKDIENIVGEDVVNDWNNKKTQLEGLYKELDTVTDETSKKNIQSQIKALESEINSNSRIQRSYAEKQNKSTEFVYKATGKESEYAKGVIDSTKGKVNNTTHSHEMADTLIKMSEERGMQYKFTNNQELQDRKIVPKGKTANGIYEIEVDGKREILVNVDSKKYLEAVLVHETAHDFKTTDANLYNNLSKATVEYAKAKGDYDTISTEVNDMYKDIKGAKIDEEITSRLLEDYLGNKEFISSLSTKEPGIVKKLIDEIKYLYKKFTASSPEARKLLELQRNMEDAYKEAYRSTEVKGKPKAEVDYSVTDDIAQRGEDALKDRIKFLEKTVDDLQKTGNRDWVMYQNELEYAKDKLAEINESSLAKGTQYSLSDATDISLTEEEITKINNAYSDKKITESLEELKYIANSTVESDPGKYTFMDRINADGKARALENGYDNVRDYMLDKALKEKRSKEESRIAEEKKRQEELAKKQEQEEQLKRDIAEADPHKLAQYNIIQETNPAPEGSNYVWIRSPKDVKTWEEVIDDEESFVWGDFSREDAQKALKRGTIRVYSSYAIKNGTFVSTSYEQALEYAGGEPSKVHSRVVSLDSVAWINGDEGQYAKVYNTQYSLSEEGKLQDNKGNEITLETSETGTTGTLMAMHNISASKIKGILELGGLPVPSIAITKPGIVDFTSYGEISILFDKNTIDPTNNLNEVYGSDVYSPRFPQTVQKVNEKAKESLEKYIGKNLNIEDTTFEDTKQKLKYDNALIDKFVEENNIEVETVYKNAPSNYGFETNEALKQFVIENDINYEKLYVDKELREKFYNLYREGTALVSFADRKIETWEKIFTQNQINADTSRRFNEDFNTLKTGAEQVVDDYATNLAKRNKVLDQYTEQYSKYLDEKLMPLFGEKYIRNDKDLYTPSGNRRSFNQLYDAYTLDNIVKRIKGKVRGEEGFFYGAGNIRSQVTPQFKSIAEIKASENKLVTTSQMDQIKEDIDSDLNNLRETAKNFGGYSYDSYETALNEIASKKKITSASAKKIFNEYGFENVPDILVDKSIEFLEKLKNAPTEYFEAKPQRAIGFDEFEAVIVPDNIDAQLEQELLDKGLNVIKYDHSIEGDRQRVINQFEDLKFSLSNQNEADVVSTDNRTASSDIKLQVEEVIAPLQETITELTNEVKTLKQAPEVRALTEEDIPFIEEMNNNPSEVAPVRNNLTLEESTELDDLELRESYLTGDEQQRLQELREKEAPIYNQDEISPTKSLFETRDYKEVGSQKIKAYQYENPEVKPYFQEMAQNMLYDLNMSTKGERVVNADVLYETNGEAGIYGTKRDTTADIEQLLDGVDGKLKLSYDEIRNGLNALIEDAGLENNKASKRIEFFIDQRLREGYTDIEGMYYPPNQEYIEVLKQKNITEYSQEAYDNWLNTLDNDMIDSLISTEDASNTDIFAGNVLNSSESTPGQTNTLSTSEIAKKGLKNDLGYIPQDPTKESTYEDSIKRDPVQEFIDKTVKKNNLNNIKETQKPKVQKSKFKNLVDTTRTMFVNRFNEVDNLAKDTGNKRLTFKADMLNSVAGEIEGDINSVQTDNYGKKVGKSVRDIFKPSKDAGLYGAFNDYLFNKSNIERHRQGKGSTVPDNVSRQLIQDYEKIYPQFKTWAKDVYKYYENVLNNEVDAGLVSSETAKFLRGDTMYPSYVPFYENIDTERYFDNRGELKAPQVLKRAKGGATNILGMEEAMIKQTYAYKSAIRKNNLYKEIVNTLEKQGLRQDVGGDARLDPTNLGDSLYIDENGNRYLTAYVNGDIKSVAISEDLYNSLENGLGQQVKELEQKFSLVTKPLQKISEIRRNLLTTWSPSFLITNPLKDIQDAIFNSKYTKDMMRNYVSAFGELKRLDNATVQQFMSLYGSSSSYGEFDIDSVNYDSSTKGKKNKFINKLVRANEILELAPRYAEFKASLQNGTGVEEAIYNARDITTNFSRGGEITKAMNRNGFTFLNASVQGFDKLYRNFSGENGAKGYVNILSKAIIYGVLPSVLNHLLLDDDEEYEVLPDYIKDNYYLFKTDDGKFIRIPKGRVISVFGSAGRRTLELTEGEEDAFEGYLKNAYSQVGISNPMESNIFAPLIQAYGSEEGKTWYGEDLVPSRLQDLPEEEQYDASTDKVSQFLGEVLGTSPYKFNYVIDQYSGGIGDLILPSITDEANSDGSLLAPLADKFTANSTTDNKNVGEIYSLSEELTKKSNSSKATEEDTLRSKYIYSITSDMNELYAERREIQNDSTLSKEEKYEKSQAIKEQINSLAKEGLENYENLTKTGNYATVGDREYYKYVDDEGNDKWGTPREDELDELNALGMDINEKSNYFKAKDTISNIKDEYKNLLEDASDDEKDLLYAEQKANIINQIKNTNLTDDQKYYLYDRYYASTDTLEVLKSVHISSDAYLDYASQTFTADKDEDGKTISGSKKTKVFDYINSMDLEFEQKVILAKMQYNSYDEYNYEIVDYLNNIETISYEEEVEILKKLGFEVSADGTVSW